MMRPTLPHRYQAPPVPLWTARTTVQRRVERAWRDSGVVVVGPASSGKTALASYVASSTGGCAWLTLSSADREPSSFATGLLEAVERQESGKERFGPGLEAQDPHVALATLAEWLKHRDVPMAIVFDEAEKISGSAGEQLMFEFLQRTRDKVRPLLSTRNPMSVRLREAVVDGRFSLVDDAALLLDAAEARELVRAICGWLSEPLVDAIVRHSEGWLGGVRLLAHAAHAGLDIRTILSGNASEIPDWVFSRLIGEVDDDLRATLFDLAPLPGFSQKVLAKIVEDRDPRTVLDQLTRMPLVVERTSDSTLTHRIHGLCRRVLRARARDRDPDQWHRACRVGVNALSEAGATAEAYQLATTSALWDEAELLLTADAQDSLVEGREHDVLRRLESWPATQLAERPRLGVMRCWALATARRDDALERAWPEISAADLSFDPQWELRRRFVAVFRLKNRALVERASTADLVGEHRRAVDAIAELLPPGLPLGGVWVMEHTRQLLREDAVASAIDAARRSPRWGLNLEPDHELWRRWWTACIHTYAGEASDLRQVGTLMLEWFDSAPDRVANFGVALTTFAWAALTLGDLPFAERALERAFELGDPHRDLENAVRLVGCAMRYASMTETTVGSGSGWDSHYTGCRAFLVARGLSAEAQVLDAMRVELCLSRLAITERRDIARAWVSDASIRDETHPAFRRPPDLAFRIDDAILLKLRASVHAGRDPTAIRNRLDEVIARAHRSGRMLCSVRAHLVRSELAYERGDEASINRALDAALLIAGPRSMSGPFLELSSPLVKRASERAKKLGFDELGLGEIVEPIAETQIGAPGLTETERRVLGLVAQGQTNKEVARELYVSPATVKKHLENVYAKLEVSGRMKASRRARELGLLEHL